MSTYFCCLFKIPEDMENFTIVLSNATGGARLGSILSASLWINRNDDPVYFSGNKLVKDHLMSCSKLYYDSLVSPLWPLSYPSFLHSPQSLSLCVLEKEQLPTSPS